MLLSSPNKQCGLDPCPTFLVKSCADILAQTFSSIINFSLSDGSFPSGFKSAVVTPSLKKASLSRNELKNYRPVSGLNFVSKLIEKVVAKQVNQHLKQHKLDNPSQSAYKAGHSTETTLLSIQDDILCAMDRGEVTALTLLDLSAAFHTIDHKMLLDRLAGWYGFSGSVLKWFRCYLSDRFQQK